MDRNEFGERARLCQTRLYKIALAILSQPYDAQDAVQDALMSAWENLPGLRNEAYFETWLTRILINRSRALLRERAARPSRALCDTVASPAPSVPDPDLRRALEVLDARYRLPLVMHCVLDMRITEVAKTLGIPYGAAKWRVHQAKKLALKHYEGGEDDAMRRKEPDWKRAYGPDPNEYTQRFETTIANLKEERIVNKKIALRTVLIAALVSLLLVSTALAVGSALGILDFFGQAYGVAPNDDAAAAISKDLGTADDGQIRLTVREAVYDGETVRALLAVEPLDKQKYIVAHDISEIIEVGDGKTAEQCADEYAQASGRTVLVVPSVWIDMKNPDNFIDSGSTARDGDALLEYCEISVNGEAPETVQIVATAAVLDGSVCEVPFSLEKTPISVQALTPGNAPQSGVTVLSASLSRTPFADYLRLIYQTAKTPYAQIAQAFAADATYHMTKNGVYAHTDPECSGMRNAEAATYQEVVAAEKMPCPICAGGDMALMAGSEAWTIELLDEEGQPVKTADSSGSAAADSEAEDAYSRLIVIQSGTLPTGNLFVRFTAPDGEVFAPIKLEAHR